MATLKSAIKCKIAAGAVSIFLLLIVGIVDALIDYKISIITLYILPIGFAAWYVGARFASTLAILSVVIWRCGDLLEGAPYFGFGIELWDGGIVLSVFLIVVYLLRTLRAAQNKLQTQVQERTAALLNEMEERKRLEQEILDLAERERQLFGHELHDVVCQELASISILAHLLDKKINSEDLKGKQEAMREITHLTDHALANARRIAHGFFTSGFDISGLAETLRGTAHDIECRYGVRCEIQWDDNLAISDENMIIHLFRIAQEAIHNAVKHAKPSWIRVNLKEDEKQLSLTIEDDGKGPSPSLDRKYDGLGLKIMSYRAKLIGAQLSVESGLRGGTYVSCSMPSQSIKASFF